MAVITISKEFGTEGEKVASLVAEKLGYDYIGKNLVAEIAKELHISESEAVTFRKASQSRILRFVDRYTCKYQHLSFSGIDTAPYFIVTL